MEVIYKHVGKDSGYSLRAVFSDFAQVFHKALHSDIFNCASFVLLTLFSNTCNHT